MTNRIDQPRNLDLVGNPILVGGVGTGHDAVLNYRVGDGHDEVKGRFKVGGGTGEHAQYQLSIDLKGHGFKHDRLTLQVFEVSPKDGKEINLVSVPIIYGEMIVTGYRGYREHTVVKGDTLWGIAQKHYGDGKLYPRIVQANPAQISDPDLIHPGQVLRVPIGR